MPHVIGVSMLLSGHRRDAYTLDMLEIPQGAGSGLIWDMTGHIVTNYHVIRGASELQVPCHDCSAVVYDCHCTQCVIFNYFVPVQYLTPMHAVPSRS